MKHYLIEPTYKKSVVEYDLWKKSNEDGKTYYLRREYGWRWGSFIIHIPETEAERTEFLEEKGYDTMDEFLDDRAVDNLTEALLPNTDDDFVEITEDYDGELVETWDGCWQTFEVFSYTADISKEEQSEIAEAAEAAYEEEYEAGVEELGWEYVSNTYEIHTKVTVKDCNERGELIPIEELITNVSCLLHL